MRKLNPVKAAGLTGLLLLMAILYQPATFTGWDESYYMAPMFSVFEDGDLVLQNNLIRFDNPMVYRYRMLNIVNPDGSLWNVFSIGPAVVYSAFSALFVIWSDPGPGPVPGMAILIGVMALGVLTLMALFHMVVALGFSRGAAGAAVAAAVMGSPFINYATRYYLNAHFLSACLAVFFYLAWLKWTESPAVRYALLAGLTGGLLMIVRWQDALICLPWIPVIFYLLWNDRSSRRIRLKGVLLALAATILPVLIQLRAWKILFDHWIVFPQGGAFMHWTDPQWKSLLFSGYHGMVPWAPGLALGLPGLLVAWFIVRRRPHKILLTGMIIAVPLILYISACADDWWAGEAYGPRRLTSLLPFAALGIAGLVHRLNRPGRLCVVLCIAFWAVVSMGAYQGRIDDMNVLFTGHPSADHPRLGTFAGEKVMNTGKIFREGLGARFSPAAPGIIIVAGLILVMMIWLWPRIRSSHTLQKRIIGLLALWVLTWVTILMLIPGNGTWNQYWLEVINYHPDPPGVEISPDDLQASAGVIRAIRHLKRDQILEFLQMHATFHPDPFEILDYDVIYDFSRDPAYEHLIDLPVIMNRVSTPQ